MKSKFYIISGNFDEAGDWVKKDLALAIFDEVEKQIKQHFGVEN